jgi:hypothetical protein
VPTGAGPASTEGLYTWLHTVQVHTGPGAGVGLPGDGAGGAGVGVVGGVGGPGGGVGRWGIGVGAGGGGAGWQLDFPLKKFMVQRFRWLGRW